MRIDLLMVYKLLEMFSNGFDILSDFFHVEISSIVLLCVASVEFDKVWVVEVAYFLKASLKDVSFHIFVYLCEGFQLLHNFMANIICTQLMKLFSKQSSIDCAESWYEKFLH